MIGKSLEPSYNSHNKNIVLYKAAIKILSKLHDFINHDFLVLNSVDFYQKILKQEKQKINKKARQLEELISQIK